MEEVTPEMSLTGLLGLPRKEGEGACQAEDKSTRGGVGNNVGSGVR